MGGMSDIKPGGIKAEGAAPADDKVAATADERMAAAGGGWLGRSWIGRHWRGELPLSVSFYINGLLCNVTLYGIVLMAHWAKVDGPGWPGMFRVAVWVFAVAAEAWFTVGVWRSAGRYTGHLIWAIIARLWVALYFVLLLSKVVPPGLPRLPS